MDILTTVRLCAKYHVLPESGGLLDQDNYFVYWMTRVMHWENVKQELDNPKGSK
jgi:hypothetical protein